MAASGKEIDANIATAVRNFRDRIDELEQSGLSDAKRIEEVFLSSFSAGEGRALELTTLSTEVADQIRKFNARSTEMMWAVGTMLVGKDLIANTATLRAIHDSVSVVEKARKEMEEVFAFLAAFREGKDPGLLPDTTSMRKISDVMSDITSMSDPVFEAGADVGATIEMMADIIELRIAFLHEFKLANLPLRLEETLERITSRFQREPASVARQTALALVKGTILAVAEHVAHWATIVDIFERLEIALLGKRLNLKPDSADALFNMRKELAAHAEALEVLFDDCKRLNTKLSSLSSDLLSVQSDKPT